MIRRGFVAAVLLAGCAQEPRTEWVFPAVDGYTQPRLVLQSFTVRNTTAQAVVGAELWFNVPRQRNSTQVLRRVGLSHPGLLKGEAGFMRLDIPPLGVQERRVQVELAQAESLQPQGDDGKTWLQPSPLVESDHPDVVKKAAGLVQPGRVETARAIHGFVSAHVVEGGFDNMDRGAAYALQSARGDCSEYASLFVALGRAAGLPSRRVSGYRCAGQCRSVAYHSWAEFHDGKAWVPVDAMGRPFVVPARDYVALEAAEERVPEPLRGHHRFMVVSSQPLQVDSDVEVQ